MWVLGAVLNVVRYSLLLLCCGCIGEPSSADRHLAGSLHITEAKACCLQVFVLVGWQCHAQCRNGALLISLLTIYTAPVGLFEVSSMPSTSLYIKTLNCRVP